MRRKKYSPFYICSFQDFLNLYNAKLHYFATVIDHPTEIYWNVIQHRQLFCRRGFLQQCIQWRFRWSLLLRRRRRYIFTTLHYEQHWNFSPLLSCHFYSCIFIFSNIIAGINVNLGNDEVSAEDGTMESNHLKVNTSINWIGCCSAIYRNITKRCNKPGYWI